MTTTDRRRRLLERILAKRCKSVGFDDLCNLVQACGCVHDRTSGSHWVYKHPALRRPIILQKPHPGSNVPRPYCQQVVKYVLEIIDYEDRR